MLRYIDISLFDSPAQTLVNTVNIVGVMGKGIALAFKQLYPDMFKEYQRLCQEGKLDTGILHIYRTPNKVIINFPTKKHWRQPSRVEYVKAGLEKFVANYTKYGISSISFPQLGCGNGELDWESQVQPLMEHYLHRLPIPVYIHLYTPNASFVPERLDTDYARQIRLERERISIDALWNDLQNLIENHPLPVNILDPRITIDEEHLFFMFPHDDHKEIVYREDIEDLWNILRLRGTLDINDVPQSIQEANVTEWVFDLLQQLTYIKPVSLSAPVAFNANNAKVKPIPLRGLRYAPAPRRQPVTLFELAA